MLANHICRYFDELNLPVLLSTTIRSATYAEGRWTIKLTTPDGPKTIVAKQLVQATGLGSQTPRIPDVPDEGYTGLSIHSTQYKSPEKLKAAGVSSVIVVGAANTAFDVLRDCADAGLNPVMVARSPTYLLPVDYLGHPAGVGAYDVMPLDDADRRFFSMPVAVEAFLAKALLSSLARDDQDRYTALKRAGFPVLDSAHPDTLLTHHLLERAGGHYIDIGGTRALEDGTATVKAGVDIVAKTERGLRFADGSTLEADAVIWCTGFVDVDATDAISPIIGDDLASRLGPTWGIDAEGEVRGVWKRTPVPNFWVMGGFTQLQRWHSRTLALQIKADLEGLLPPAYMAESNLLRNHEQDSPAAGSHGTVDGGHLHMQLPGKL